MVDTLILNNLLSATKKMLGNGQAWLVNTFNIQEVLKSFLIIPEVARDYFIAIAGTPFPVNQIGLIPDDNLDQSLNQWEKQFNIIPAETATLEERALAVEAAWSATGSLGRGYLENILRSAGLLIRIRENIPAIDYTVELDSQIQYGSTEYNDFLGTGGNVNYGGGSAAFLLGNGALTDQSGSVGDIVNMPTTVKEWQKIVIVEGDTPGTYVTMNPAQYQLFLQLFLKYKAMEAVGLIRILVA